MSSIKLKFATVSIDSTIVFVRFTPDTELGVPEMKELVAAAEKLSWSKPYFTLSDVRKGISVTRPGKAYLSDHINMPFFRGAAVLVKNDMMSFAINFLSYFQRNKYPFKAFTSQKKALEWLGTLPLDENPDAGWQLA